MLEEHYEDPRLLQIKLLGEGVVESILRGETVGITSRRSRAASQVTKLDSSTAPSKTLNRLEILAKTSLSTLATFFCFYKNEN